MPVGVTEDPNYQSTFAEPELEDASTELAAKFRVAHTDPLLLKDRKHSGTNRSSFTRR